MATTFRYTINNLIICKNCSKCRTPVYHGFIKESNTPVHEQFLLCGFAQCVPLIGCDFYLVCACCIDITTTLLTQFFNKFRDWFCFFLVVVVITVEHLYECPLCPVVVAWITSSYLAAPIEAETYLVKLFAIAVDILLCCYCRVLSCLYSILFGWKSICVVTHRIKYIETLKSFETCKNVRSNISKRVSYVQSCSRWIGEHVKNIEFLFVTVFIHTISVVFFPPLLPLLLNVVKIVCHIFNFIISTTSSLFAQCA